MVEFLLTYVFTLSATEAIIQFLVFTVIKLTTSALVDVHGYLLDFSGDENIATARPVIGNTSRASDSGGESIERD